MSGAVEVFRGIIFSDSIDTDGRMTVTAYDRNVYLTKNTDSRKFEKMTASAIIKALCAAFEIPMGIIADTGYVIPKLVFDGKTLWDMMVTALTYTKKQTGTQYFIYSDGGKLSVGQFTKPTSRVVLEPGVNLTSVSRSTSIDEVSTRLRLYGKGKDSIDITVSDDALVKKYGVMQTLEKPDESTTSSAAKQRAETLLNAVKVPSDDLHITCLGIDDVISGSAVYLISGMVGASGGYYVASDTHTYDGEMHTMSLRLSATEVIPALEYDGATTTTKTSTTDIKKSKKKDGDVLDKIKGTDDSTI